MAGLGRGRMCRAKAALTAGMAAVAGLAGLTGAAWRAPAAAATRDPGGATISVLYSDNYVFDTDALATTWWRSIARQWTKLDPSAPLHEIGVGGTDVDEMSRAALLFRHPSETPCVIQLPTSYIGELAGAGRLAPLDSYLNGASAPGFWTGMPAGVQQMGSIDGTVYAVDAGSTDSALLYDKAMLEKAGVPVPWAPKSWQDILTVAEKVHRAEPKVWPLWLASGNAVGPTNVLEGIGNLLEGSTNPTMFDARTNKWVTDSPGLQATLQLYKTVAEEGLNAPASQLLAADSVGQPPLLMQQGDLAIAVGANWYTGEWLPDGGAPWSEAAQQIGIAPIPTEYGQAPGSATTLGGWAWAITATCSDKAAAFRFITLAQQPTNQLETAAWSGLVPPDTSVGTERAFAGSALYQLQFSTYAEHGTALPNDVSFPVYARALDTVTGDFALHPTTSIAAALSTMNQLITEQLGPGSTETQS